MAPEQSSGGVLSFAGTLWDRITAHKQAVIESKVPPRPPHVALGRSSLRRLCLAPLNISHVTCTHPHPAMYVSRDMQRTPASLNQGFQGTVSPPCNPLLVMGSAGPISAPDSWLLSQCFTVICCQKAPSPQLDHHTAKG